MLGNGRPFMIQLINPRKVLNQRILTNIQQHINSSPDKLVAVRDLQLVSRYIVTLFAVIKPWMMVERDGIINLLIIAIFRSIAYHIW